MSDVADEWLERRTYTAKTAEGWNVVFAKLNSGVRPAVQYLKNEDPDNSDPTFPVTEKHLRQVCGGVFGNLNTIGPYKFEGTNMFTIFVGPDAVDGMCEVGIVRVRGHRLLGFMRHPRTIVITNGFRKPPQPETPPQQKTRARAILAEHLRREAAQARGSRADRPRKEPQPRRQETTP